MFTILKNVKYSFIFTIIYLNKAEANNENLLFMEDILLKQTKSKELAVYLSFFNNSENEIEIESFSTDIANSVEMHDIKITDDVVKCLRLRV